MEKSSFWDDLGNTLTRKAKGLSSRAENLYEIQKIRNKLSAQERMTEKLMMDIGKMIYTRYEQGEAVDGETGAICEEISSICWRQITTEMRSLPAKGRSFARPAIRR
mgnify:CR=1 FL=1